jgi:alkaline phosphatase D
VTKLGRRTLVGGALGLAGCSRFGCDVTPPLALQIGDVTPTSAIAWAAADREATLELEWATNPSFSGAQRAAGARTGPAHTARLALDDLPPGEEIHVRAWFDRGDAALARFRTPGEGDAVFAWSGDTCGQGWGIDRARGGMRCYETVRALDPDVFIHCGDLIYADGPLQRSVALPDGTSWQNLVTPAKSRVAETLDDLRGCFAYNFLDDHFRRMHAEVAVVSLWDDHEVHNNWYPNERLDDGRYRDRSVAALSGRARQAFGEYTAIRGETIHRVIPRGPLLDVFVLDGRSFRADNGPNDEAAAGPTTRYFGAEQLAWLAGALGASRATWKVVAVNAPLTVVIPDGNEHEGVANGPGAPRGREHELAELLTTLHTRGVQNFLFVTADVHYTAAHHCDPARARFAPFTPFWHFISGPMHAGNFGPNPLDDTFGPEVRFELAAPEANAPPSAGYQFFGHGKIDRATRALTVCLRDVSGAVLYEVELEPKL